VQARSGTSLAIIGVLVAVERLLRGVRRISFEPRFRAAAGSTEVVTVVGATG
jgi:hypothetical protein